MARGSVFKRSGGWAFKIDTGFQPESGKRRQTLKQGFRTKREAENALAEAQKMVIDGTVVATSKMHLDDFLDHWSRRRNLSLSGGVGAFELKSSVSRAGFRTPGPISDPIRRLTSGDRVATAAERSRSGPLPKRGWYCGCHGPYA